MTTSEIARRAGVNVQTLRYYERRGLVPKPRRMPNGYRSYGSDALARIRFIKRAQNLGFSLTEIDQLLRLQSSRARPESVRRVAEQKLSEVSRKIRELTAVQKALESLVDDCKQSCTPARCPILDALGRDVDEQETA